MLMHATGMQQALKHIPVSKVSLVCHTLQHGVTSGKILVDACKILAQVYLNVAEIGQYGSFCLCWRFLTVPFVTAFCSVQQKSERN